MNRVPLIIALVAITFSIAYAKPAKLPAFSIGEVQARCAKVHGAFYNHDGAYGCAFAKGTVQCDGISNCVGYSNARAYRQPLLPQQPPPDQYQNQDQRWYHDRW